MEKNYIEATSFLTIAINLDPLNFQFYLDKLNCLKKLFTFCGLNLKKFELSKSEKRQFLYEN